MCNKKNFLFIFFFLTPSIFYLLFLLLYVQTQKKTPLLPFYSLTFPLWFVVCCFHIFCIATKLSSTLFSRQHHVIFSFPIPSPSHDFLKLPSYYLSYLVKTPKEKKKTPLLKLIIKTRFKLLKKLS